MYSFLGKFTATAGNQRALADQLIKGTELWGSPKGLIQYLIYTGADESVWVSELWETEVDHNASLELPGVRELIGETKPLIGGMDVFPIELVGGVGPGTS